MRLRYLPIEPEQVKRRFLNAALRLGYDRNYHLDRFLKRVTPSEMLKWRNLGKTTLLAFIKAVRETGRMISIVSKCSRCGGVGLQFHHRAHMYTWDRLEASDEHGR